MSEETTVQVNPLPPGTERRSAIPSLGQISAVLKSTGTLRTPAKRRETFAYLLDELKNEAKPIPDTFVSVDRNLPSAPAPEIMTKALQRCCSVFLDLSEEAHSIRDSREQVLEAICRYADENTRLACAASMSEFETRIIEQMGETAISEVNACYEQLTRLVSADPAERSLPWQSRLLALSHFLQHCARPETLSQGTKMGAQIICLTQRLITSKPSRLAELLAAATIEGNWKTFDGKTITIDEHSLKPGPEELRYLAGDNQRSFAAKIIQCFLLNDCLMRRPKPLIYSETPGRPGRDYSGQIVRTPEGNPVNPKFGAALSLVELALIARFEFNVAACIIVNDASFSANTAEFGDGLSRQNYLKHIRSVDELGEALVQARTGNSMPAIVAVDERRLLAESYRDGINHTVNVVNFSEYGMLKLFNPHLLPGMQRVARINLQRLYNATLSNPGT